MSCIIAGHANDMWIASIHQANDKGNNIAMDMVNFDGHKNAFT
ncbi:MAG: hypothetical protein AB3N63_13420 [Puniceicoccaceae bacterium]